jgi:patatin-like phospholipase/acyl hydrolase
MTQEFTRKRIAVLSIDGGGIRGIIAARILMALRKAIGRDLHEMFHLITGTSTGGIIALGIASGVNKGQPFTPADLLQLYLVHGPRIFKKSWYTPVAELFHSKYAPQALEEVLLTYFGEAEFSCVLTSLLIASYDLQSQQPFFFKSHKIGADPNYDWRLTQIARATSAAPTYFPPLHLQCKGQDYALIDGGVFANNPAMAAYAEARRICPTATEFLIVSVGTGDRYDQIPYARAKDWGLLGWSKQIVPVLMDSVSEAVDYELNWIAGTSAECKYYRLQPALNIASKQIDDVSPENLKNLQIEAEIFIRDNAHTLRRVCDDLHRVHESNMHRVKYASG